MPQARDEAGNIWETDAQGNAIRLLQPAAGGRQATIIANPYRQREEGRKDEDQAFERERLRIAQEASDRSAANDRLNPERAAADIAKTQQSMQDRPFERGDKLRDDFNALPAVKEYRTALPSLMAGLKSADDPGGDNALIYAYAKAMDPGSVVRESEMGMASGTGSFLESTVGNIKKQLGWDGGGLAPEVRQRLRREMNSKVAQLAKSYGVARSDYQQVAQRQGVNPEDVVGNYPAAPFIKDYERLAGRLGQDSVSVVMGERAPDGGASPRGYQNDPSGDRTFQSDVDRTYQNEVETAFKRGASREQLDAIARKYGAPAFGDDLDRALRMRAANPAAPVGFTTPATGKEEGGLTGALLGGMADSGFGSYAIGAGNAVTAGQLGNIAELTGSSEGGTDLAMQMARQNGPAYFGGEVMGGVLGALGTQGALGAVASRMAPGAAATALASPLTADALYGAVSGAGSADDPLYGAIGGGFLGLGGSYLGQRVGQGIAGARRPQGIDPLNRGQRDVLGAVNQTGIGDVEAALLRAQELGVPASIADVSPEALALTGSAIRNNPTVAGQARQTLMQRGRGQVDRLREAVARDLGPLDNVVERSDELIAQARDAASPLYAEAYAAPVVSTPEIAELLATPFGRQGLGYAQKIAANERRNTQAMGFALDAEGNPVLNPIPADALAVLGKAESDLFKAEEFLKRAKAGQLTGTPVGNVNEAEAAYQAAAQQLADAQAAMAAQPSVGTLAEAPGYTTQTIDYAKRGMDKVLEQYRDPITSRLVLDELGKSENSVLRSLLGEADRTNPAFGQARAAYAGPASEREALSLGRDAWSQNTDQLGVQVGAQSPSQLGQFQLGARDALVKKAEELRMSGNPWSALDTPAMEQRLGTVFDDPEAIARLLSQRDLEGQMAGTANRLVGNSATAERVAADAAFTNEGMARPMIEAGIETAISGAPIMTIGRRLANSGFGQRLTEGTRRRAAERAEQIAPLTLNTAPGDAIAELLAIARQASDYEAARAALARTGARPGALVGTGVATGLIPLYSGQ